jgi:hypothetical protein
VYLSDLLAAGYPLDEVRCWGVVEYHDDAGEPYYLRGDLAPWLDAEGEP